MVKIYRIYSLPPPVQISNRNAAPGQGPSAPIPVRSPSSEVVQARPHPPGPQHRTRHSWHRHLPMTVTAVHGGAQGAGHSPAAAAGAHTPAQGSSPCAHCSPTHSSRAPGAGSGRRPDPWASQAWAPLLVGGPWVRSASAHAGPAGLP